VVKETGLPDALLKNFLSELWLPAIRPTLRSTTHYSYVGIVRTHIEPVLGDNLLVDLTPQSLNAFYAYLLAAGHTKRPGGLAPTSVIRIHATLHRALRDAVRWGYLFENPADRSDPPKQKTRSFEMTTWGAVELRRFLEVVRTEEDYAYWLLLVMTGMRRGEVLGLRWKDVNLGEGVIAVRQAVVSVGARRELSTPKTSRGRRLVALDADTVEALQLVWKNSHGGPEALIFAEHNGGPLSGSSVTKRFKSLVAKADLPPIRLHDLRHTHATLALQAGVHPKIVSERLGHSTVAFTLDVYSHATPHMQGEAAERIGNLVRGR
jgi:integrase